MEYAEKLLERLAPEVARTREAFQDISRAADILSG
jgi:hypothetical protein